MIRYKFLDKVKIISGTDKNKIGYILISYRGGTGRGTLYDITTENGRISFLNNNQIRLIERHKN